MRLEGTLDAFSLPDIFQLLSFTKKTGTLHLRREQAHGAVHLRGGTITGARADVSRQELGRRLLGTGLADDEALASAAEQLAEDPTLSLAGLLTTAAGLAPEAVRVVAAEQVGDAVFSLLRWPEGEFSFVVDEADPDDLGVEIAVEHVIAEGERRLAGWAELVEAVPAPVTVLTLNPAPPGEPTASREEWALLALVDGRRTVADLVVLSGAGEYAVVAALAGLVARGLLVARTEVGDQLGRRMALLAALEGHDDEALAAEPILSGAAAPEASTPPTIEPEVPQAAEPERATAPSAQALVPEPAAEVGVGSEGGPAADEHEHEDLGIAVPEQHATTDADIATPRLPASIVPQPAFARSGGYGSTSGATALQPSAEEDVPAPQRGVGNGVVHRDPAVNRTLLLRLIAGVRGL